MISVHSTHPQHLTRSISRNAANPFCHLSLLLVLLWAPWAAAQQLPHLDTDASVQSQACERAEIILSVQGEGDSILTSGPLDVVLVLDKSGSMAGQPFADAQTAFKTLIDQFDPAQDRVALVSYSTTATVHLPLSHDLDSVKHIIDLLGTSGFTNTGDAVFRAQLELGTSARQDAVPVMVVLSDGVANRSHDGIACTSEPTSPNHCTQDALLQADMARNAGTVLYTVGFRLPQISEPTQTIARDTLEGMVGNGGIYIEAPTAQQLIDAFAQMTHQVSDTAGTDVQVVEVLPPGVSYVKGTALLVETAPDQTTSIRAEEPGGLPGPTLTWDLGTLANGQSYDVRFEVEVAQPGMALLLSAFPESRVIYRDINGNTQEASFPQALVDVSACSASVGGIVWDDQDGDGLHGNEPGFAGVTISLYTDQDVLVGSMTTGADGSYLFTDVAVGQHYLLFQPPQAAQLSPQDVGSDDSQDSDPEPATGRTDLFTLGAGTTDMSWSAGVLTSCAGTLLMDYVVDQPVVRSGDTVVYTYTVQTTCPQGVSSVSVDDSHCNSPQYVAGDANQSQVLEPNETWVYSCSRMLTADITSVASATALDPTGLPLEATATLSVNVITPAIGLAKTVDKPLAKFGEQITYTYAVTNQGNVPLSNVVMVDDVCATPSFIAGDTNQNGILDLTETWTFTCSAILTQATDGLATATGVDSLGGTVQATANLGVDISNPAIGIVGSINGQDASQSPGPALAVGQQVTRQYVVTNTGNVTLTDITLIDDTGTPISCSQDTLAVGESMTCSVTGSAEAGLHPQTVAATGHDSLDNPATAEATTHYLGIQAGIQVEKSISLDQMHWIEARTSPGPEVAWSMPLYFQFVVTNTGNVPLTNVSLRDTRFGRCPCDVPDELAPGESFTAVVRLFCASDGQHTDTATASGIYEGVTYSDTDVAYYIGDLSDGCSTCGTISASQGDATGDGVVDLADFAVLASAFGSADTSADFNGDGIVDLGDFNILAQHFGRHTSTAPLTPAGMPALQLRALNTPQPGGTVDIAVACEVPSVQAFSFELQYDASLLERVDEWDTPASAESFVLVWQNRVVGVCLGKQLPDNELARLRFQIDSEEPANISVTNVQVWDPELGTRALQNSHLPIRVAPRQTALLPNYPNPFNPETWIGYDLAGKSPVVITIHDVLGNVVRKLDLGIQPAGHYRTHSLAAHWDGRNERGDVVGSGVYFYTLQASDHTMTRKMILRK